MTMCRDSHTHKEVIYALHHKMCSRFPYQTKKKKYKAEKIM